MSRKINLLASILVFSAATAACSNGPRDVSAQGEPQYVYERVSAMRSNATLHVTEPESLAGSLPGAEISVTDPKSGQEVEEESLWSDVVLTGNVVKVAPGDAIFYENLDPASPETEEEIRSVDFDDPNAHERNVVISIQPDWSAGENIPKSVDFRMGVIGGGDPYKFMESLRGLQDDKIVVVLKARESGMNVGEYYPIMGGALLGTVTEGGALAFPGLNEDEATFVGELDTVEELKEEAERTAARD